MATFIRKNPALNAAKHFCTARTLIIGDEKMEEFDELIAEFTREYKPRTKLDRQWIESAARALWFSRRSNREFDNMMQRLSAGGRTPAEWDPPQQAEHDRILRYRKSDQREFERACRGVEHLRLKRQQRRRERRLAKQAAADLARKVGEITTSLVGSTAAKLNASGSNSLEP